MSTFSQAANKRHKLGHFFALLVCAESTSLTPLQNASYGERYV